MAMAAESGSMASTVIYQEVKAWIAKQEAFEAQYNRPAPLTDAQRMALQSLRLPSTTPSSTPPSPSPAVGGGSAVNYVGILTEYYSKRQQLHGLHWVEETSGILPGGVTGRVCRAIIVDSLAHESGNVEYFPAKGYGLNDDGSEPCFPNKKAAKQFAAKCAVDWLVAQGLMAHNLATTPPPHATSPPSATPQASPAVQTTKDAVSPPAQPQTPSGFDGTHEVPTMNSRSSRAPTVVADLCSRLGFPPPRYNVIENLPGEFSGIAQFDDYGDVELIALTRASRVEGMTGKEVARQAIARKLLKQLQEIAAERDAQLQLVLDQLGSES